MSSSNPFLRAKMTRSDKPHHPNARAATNLQDETGTEAMIVVLAAVAAAVAVAAAAGAQKLLLMPRRWPPPLPMQHLPRRHLLPPRQPRRVAPGNPSHGPFMCCPRSLKARSFEPGLSGVAAPRPLRASACERLPTKTRLLTTQTKDDPNGAVPSPRSFQACRWLAVLGPSSSFPLSCLGMGVGNRWQNGKALRRRLFSLFSPIFLFEIPGYSIFLDEFTIRCWPNVAASATAESSFCSLSNPYPCRTVHVSKTDSLCFYVLFWVVEICVLGDVNRCVQTGLYIKHTYLYIHGNFIKSYLHQSFIHCTRHMRLNT